MRPRCVREVMRPVEDGDVAKVVAAFSHEAPDQFGQPLLLLPLVGEQVVIDRRPCLLEAASRSRSP